MSTDLANLGPSLMRTADFGVKDSKRDQLLTPKSGTDSADTFAKTLKEKVGGKVEEKRSQSSEPRMAQERSTKSAERDSGNEAGDAKETVRKTAKEGKEAKKASKSVTREQAMLEFMDSMESELGIPPAEMLEAMANLSEGDQLLPPDATASKVISQLATDLELSPEDQEKAMALYAELLANINQQTLPQTPAAMPELGTSHELLKNPLSTKDKRQVLNDSLDRLNQKFFMQEIRGTQGTADKLMSLPVDKAGDLQLPPQVSSQFSQEALMANSELPNMDLSKVQIPQEMQAPSDNGGYGDLAKSLAALGLATKSLEGALPKNVQAMTQDGSQVAAPQINLMSQMPNVQAQLSNQSGDGMAQFSDQGASSDEDVLKIGESTGREFRMPELMTHADRSRLDSSMGLGAGIGGASGLNAASKAEAEPNVQQLMNQANYLVKKGGGEASIILNPEGLGKVHLKVAISEGKVDLQMRAETTEAKKLLESSLSDLKSGLAAQRLNLDHVRVDVGNQASSNHDNRQNQQQQHQPSYDQAREQARQFFGQFRDDNSGKRDGVWESPGIRSYGRSRQVNALDPAPVEGKRIARELGSTRGKGLDLVA